MIERGFTEFQTPILTSTSPEGARDYLVPSRIHQGKFYALPQAPQQFKQLLMIAGFDKYFQMVRCFRDEDLRSDRQPEFTQIDMEMSFIEEEDIYSLLEKMMKHIFKEVLNVEIKSPFPRITHKEAMNKYHTDRPHLKKDNHKYSFLWVIDFPLFDYNKDEKRFVSTHHPFTMPIKEHINIIDTNPEKVIAHCYDLVCNGLECGSGSIRIHTRKLQEQVFGVLGYTKEEISSRFVYIVSNRFL